MKVRAHVISSKEIEKWMQAIKGVFDYDQADTDGKYVLGRGVEFGAAVMADILTKKDFDEKDLVIAGLLFGKDVEQGLKEFQKEHPCNQ